MIKRSEFFDALAKGALWDVGVAINRTNPLPLDKFSVFGAYSDGKGDNGTDSALGYAKNSVIAYPGQIIAVVAGTDEAPVTTVYVIKKTGTSAELESLGSSNAISALDTRLTTLEGEVVKTVTGDKAVKATKVGNAVTLATQTSAVEGNILEIKDDGLYVPAPEEVTVPTYRLKNITGSDSPYAAVYHLSVFNGDTEDTSANTGVDINIPKDKFLKSVTLEHYEAGSLPTGVTAPGTYLKFVFENITDPVYLNVNEFLDGVIYTGGIDSKGTDPNKYSTIQVNVDPLTHVITASILDGGVHTDELADSAVTTIKIADNAVTEKKILNGAVTADKIAANAVTDAKIKNDAVTEQKIKNGAVTLDKLSSGVQASLGKADSAIRKVKVNGTELTPDADKAVNVTVATGTANGHIAVNGVDVKVAGLNTAAYETKESFDHAIADAKKAVLGDPETDTAESNTVHGVKKKAEANATAITGLQNGKVDKLEGSMSGVNYQVYAVSPTGEQTGLNTVYGGELSADTWNYGGGTVVLAEEGTGAIPVVTPTKGYHAANKKYVDDTVNTAVSSGITVEDDRSTTGKYVTAVTKTGGKIIITKGTPAVDLSELTDTTNILDSKANVTDLNQAKTDLTGAINQVKTDLTTEIGKKQNALSFEGTPSADNKVITKSAMDSAISTATAGLTGAMHFVGNSTSDPLGASGPTIAGHTGAFKSGDVCTYQKKEFVYDGTSWRELGSEGSYILKNSEAITNADIADAAIAQSKIDGLTTALASKIEGMSLDGINPYLTQEFEVANGKIKMPYANGNKFGVVKVVDNPSDVNNAIEMSLLGNLLVNNVTTDIIKNGANTLILNGGGATL